MKIRVMSAESAFHCVYTRTGIVGSLNYAIISIQDCAESNMPFKYKKGGNCKDALNVWFSDITNGMEDVEKIRHPEYSEHIKLITQEDAVKICNFVSKVQKLGVDELIVHCRAGQSRSAGVGAALSKLLTGDDTAYFNGSGGYTPNMSVYSMVLNTWFNLGLPIFGIS